MTSENVEQPQALTIQEFCDRYCIGRTKAYELLNANEVEARKSGNRTLVVRESAEKWFSTLPLYSFELD